MAYPPNDPLSNGATSTDYNKLRLEYDYDSFGNVKTLREANNGASPPATFTFSYDAHNRLTQAFGQSYSYDSAGRITSYEGVSHGYAAAPGHGVNTVGGADRFDYDANGNVTLRNKGLSTQQTLTWSHENRLASLTATGINESYLYDDAGIRVKKVSGSTTTYYPFPHYEVSGSTVTKYYFFNGQRVAMKVGSTLTYLHPDHLGSTAQATDSSGGIVANQGYHGYGKYRLGGALPTDHRYTGQKLDTATGLMYYGARYYDRQVGTFISPDTLVPDPTHLWDYNRFGYARLNPMKYNDPTGHCASYSSIGEEPQPKPGDQDCWGLVDHILGLWERDQSGYWQQRWVSQDIFRKYIAATPSNDSAFMLQEINLYWNSETYQQWAQQQPNVMSTTSSGDLMCGSDQACQTVVKAANQVAEKCQEIDCIAVGNDVVGVGSALLVVGSPFCGPAALGCAAAGGTLGNASTAFGAVWTVYNYTEGRATNADLAVTLPLAMKAVTTKDPKVSATVAILQVIWDAFLSPDDRW